jgi:hypothetical protein
VLQFASAYTITLPDSSLQTTIDALRELNQRLFNEIVDLCKECNQLKNFAGIWDNENPDAPHSTPFTVREFFLERFPDQSVVAQSNNVVE